MAIFVDQMFNTAGESTSLADMNEGTSAAVAKYAPKYDGKLMKILVFIGSEAATSLVEDVRVELECSIWKPNRLRFAANGSGLRTATTPQHFPFEYVIDQDVKTNQGIVGQYIHDSGSPVTSRIRVYGVFQTNG